MSIRKLFAIIVALAILFVPGAAAVAMASPQSDMQVMQAGHCQAPPSSSGGHEKTAGKNCCISMCMALAIAPSAPLDVRLPGQQIAEFPVPVVYNGSPHEIATPPPRRS